MKLPHTIDLNKPITIGDVTHKSLTFDEPDLRTSIAVEEVGEDAMQQTIKLLAGMAEVDDDVILRIKASDWDRVTNEVLNPYQAMVQAEVEKAGNADPAATQ